MKLVLLAGLLLVPLLLAGCDGPAQPAADGSAGAALEHAAVAAGLVPDPSRAVLTGAWSRDSDRLCTVPRPDGGLRVGAVVDYGEGAGCSGAGTARRTGDGLAIDFGACRLNATFDGERIVFPAEVPDACDALCTGRASFAALDVAQISESLSEAKALRSPTGDRPCAD